MPIFVAVVKDYLKNPPDFEKVVYGIRKMSHSGAYPLSESSRRYWQKKGLLPDPGDTSLIGQRRRRFVDQCFEMGFRPARLMKLKQAAGSEERELHQLTAYSSDSGLLSHDLVIRNGHVMEEPGTGQMLFAFSAPVETQITALQEVRDPLQAIFDDGPDEDHLEARLQAFVTEQPGSLEAWIELGNLLFQKSRYTEAEGCYERARALDGNCAEALYNIAGCHVQKKEYAAAIRAYHMSIQIKPIPEALYSLGLLYLSLNYVGPAIQTLQAVVQSDSGQWAESARQFIEDIEQLSLYGDTE